MFRLLIAVLVLLTVAFAVPVANAGCCNSGGCFAPAFVGGPVAFSTFGYPTAVAFAPTPVFVAPSPFFVSNVGFRGNGGVNVNVNGGRRGFRNPNVSVQSFGGGANVNVNQRRAILPRNRQNNISVQAF